MAVSEMKRLSLVALRSDADALLNELMWSGSVEITDAAEGVSDLPAARDPFEGEIGRYSSGISAIETALSQLKPYRSAPKGLFPKKKEYARKDYEKSGDIIAEEALKTAAEAKETAKTLVVSQNEINRLSSERSALDPWKDYDLALSEQGTDKVDIVLATYPSGREISALCQRFDGVTDRYEVQIVGSDESSKYLFIASSREFTDELLRSSVDIGLARQDFSEYGALTPSEAMKSIEAKKEALEKSKTEATLKLKELAERCPELEFAYDVLNSKLQVAQAKQKLLCTENAVIMTGWIPEVSCGEVEKKLEGYRCAYEFGQAGDDPAKVPVLLSNGPLSGKFETVVEMYSLPLYKTFDPTKIMSIFYFIIFGMMFGDVVYGLILTLGGLLLTKLVPLGKGAKQLIGMFAICGVSSMIWGVLFGSYAGNLLAGLIPPIAFDIVDQPIYFLILALAIGALHLLVAMGIRFYILCREHKVFDAIVEVGTWYLIFAGIAIAILVDQTAGIIMAGVGAGVIVLFHDKSKNPVLRILKGLLGLYDIVNFASDLLSYSRIMALGLSSAIIAMVINTLADLPGKSPLGIVFMILILLLGHIINIALNVLGTFIHTSRLQYIEFFGKFYVDGGNKFRPLALDPKYTAVKE